MEEKECRTGVLRTREEGCGRTGNEEQENKGTSKGTRTREGEELREQERENARGPGTRDKRTRDEETRELVGRVGGGRCVVSPPPHEKEEWWRGRRKSSGKIGSIVCREK